MATTSRKKRVQQHKIQEPVQPPPYPKTELTHLNHTHLLQLETIGRDVEKFRLLMNVEEQNLRNLVLERQILDAKIEKLKIVLNERARDYAQAVEGFKRFKAELWPQYGLKEADGLGYNPMTGEIVRQ